MVLLAPAAAAGSLVSAIPARADNPTISLNSLRTAWDAAEPNLGPAQVSASDFGRRWSTAVDGAVFAQPLVAGSTVVVATETNHVYGVSATDGRILWQRALGTPVPSSTACLSPGPASPRRRCTTRRPTPSTWWPRPTRTARTSPCTPSTPPRVPSGAAGRSPSRAIR
ncbi:PQQ-binding-like beta-propeller repeat protein [Kitasatospora aburaviensis]